MSAPRKRRVFPFTAVIGQEEMKLASFISSWPITAVKGKTLRFRGALTG